MVVIMWQKQEQVAIQMPDLFNKALYNAFQSALLTTQNGNCVVLYESVE